MCAAARGARLTRALSIAGHAAAVRCSRSRRSAPSTKIGEIVVRSTRREPSCIARRPRDDRIARDSARGDRGSPLSRRSRNTPSRPRLRRWPAAESLNYVLDKTSRSTRQRLRQDYPADRHFRDARVSLFEGTNENSPACSSRHADPPGAERRPVPDSLACKALQVRVLGRRRAVARRMACSRRSGARSRLSRDGSHVFVLAMRDLRPS